MNSLRYDGLSITGYDAEPNDVDISTVDLDPVKVAGGASVPKLRSAAATLESASCTQAVRILYDDEPWKRSIVPDPAVSDHTARVGKKWNHHLAMLLSFAILSVASYATVVWSHGYFAVSKNFHTRPLNPQRCTFQSLLPHTPSGQSP